MYVYICIHIFIYLHTHIYIYTPTLIITNLSLWTRLKLACVYPLPHAMHTAPWACSCRLLDTLAYGIRMEVLTLSVCQHIKGSKFKAGCVGQQ